MSLSDDLKAQFNRFMEEDREERRRRKAFEDKWRVLLSGIIPEAMYEVAHAAEQHGAFSADVKPHHVHVALHLSFEDASKKHNMHRLVFAPDADLINILCTSTLVQEPLSLDIDGIDQALLESILRKFVSEFLDRLRYPAAVKPNQPKSTPRTAGWAYPAAGE